MRIKFTFELPKGKLELPVHYNHMVQGVIYKNLSEKLAGFLHNKGFGFEKRRFKLFTFSRLLGVHRIGKRKPREGVSRQPTTITFFSSFSFYLSSPYKEILQEFANRMAAGTAVRFGAEEVFISSLQVLAAPVLKNPPVKVKMLSPMTIRSTLVNKEGVKKSYYYSPLEKEFSGLMGQNLLKKYYSFHGAYPENREFIIEPYLFSDQENLRKMNYKGFVIKAYDGIFRLSGSEELIGFAYDCGLGERSAQGLGMFEVWQEKSHQG